MPRTATAIVPLRHRADGFTPIKQRAFLRALAETGCLKDACAKVGLSKTSAYRLRSKSGAFAKLWDQAVAQAQPTLEQAAYERAVEGIEEPVIRGGAVIATRRRYSDGLLKTLLEHSWRRAESAKLRKEIEREVHESIARGEYDFFIPGRLPEKDLRLLEEFQSFALEREAADRRYRCELKLMELMEKYGSNPEDEATLAKLREDGRGAGGSDGVIDLSVDDDDIWW